MNSQQKIIPRAEIGAYADLQRSRGKKVVFTNGCFDILHAGHVELMEQARGFGDVLIVGVNCDATVKRLKGESRPIHRQEARAYVLAGLGAVDAVCIFDEDTPNALIEEVRPHIHVKGGDYKPDDLPEAEVVRRHGGEVRIVPLLEGYSTTNALRLQQAAEQSDTTAGAEFVLIIPARYESTRLPGKPLAELGGRTVIEHVVRAGLRTRAQRPILVATDDLRIAAVVRDAFRDGEAEAVMTGAECRTGTDRLAEVVRSRFAGGRLRQVVINLQGDEPFVNPLHVDALIERMEREPKLLMATLATPLEAAAQDDVNVVKVVVDSRGRALYFSRLPIPFERDGAGPGSVRRLRHLGVYAYTAQWLLEFAALPASPLENAEKLEQLRALENGVAIGVEVVHDVINIAIDTPADLAAARAYLGNDVAAS